jgi:tetratricopeptide (TPR) repeat protein
MSAKLINIALGLVVIAILAVLGLIVYQKINPSQQSSLDKKIAVWGQAVQDTPDSGSAHANLGALYRDAGKFDESITELQKAVELVPDGQTYWHELALSYRAKGDMGSAADALNKALELFPEGEKYTIYYELAEINRDQGDMDGAKQNVTLAIQDNDVTWDAHFLLGQLYQREGDNANAKKEYQSAAAFTPDNPQVQEALQQVS